MALAPIEVGADALSPVEAKKPTAPVGIPVDEEAFTPVRSNLFSGDYWKRQATRHAEAYGTAALEFELALRDLGGHLGGTPAVERKKELVAGIEEGKRRSGEGIAVDESFLSKVVSGVTGMGPEVPGLVLGPAGVAATFGLGQYLDTYGTGRVEGAGEGKSALTAALTGAEAAGIGWAMGPATGKVAEGLGKLGMDRVLGSVGEAAAKRIVSNALVGMGLMTSMSEATAFTEQVAFDRNETWEQYLKRVEARLPGELALGLGTGAIFGATHEVPGLAREAVAGPLSKWATRPSAPDILRIPSFEGEGDKTPLAFPPVTGVESGPKTTEIESGTASIPTDSIRVAEGSASRSGDMEPWDPWQLIDRNLLEGKVAKPSEYVAQRDAERAAKRAGAGDYERFDPFPNAEEPGTGKEPTKPFSFDAEGLAADERVRRTSALVRLRQIEKWYQQGKLSDRDYVLQTKELLADLELKQDARTLDAFTRGRARGPDWIRERLLRASRNGELTPEAVELADWFLQKNPQAARGLGISIGAQGPEGVAGRYFPTERIIRLIKGTPLDDVVVHEILHHTERMLPPAVRQGLIESWGRTLAKEIEKAEKLARAANASQGDKARARALKELPKAAIGDQAAKDFVFEFFKQGVLRPSDYHLLTPSEYWAMNASRIVGERYAAVGWTRVAKQWLAEFWEKLKGLANLKSDAPFLRGLKELSRSSGTFQAGTILADSAVTREVAIAHAAATEIIANALAPAGLDSTLGKEFVEELAGSLRATPDQWKELADLLNPKREGPRVEVEFRDALINGLFDPHAGLSASELINALRDNLIGDTNALDSAIDRLHKIADGTIPASLNLRTIGESLAFKKDQKALRERLLGPNGDIDRFGTFTKWAQTLLQIAKKNPHIPELKSYVAHQMGMWQKKTQWTSRADSTLKKWDRLGKEQRQLLTQLKFEETVKGKAFTQQELMARGLGQEALKVSDAIADDFRDMLGEIEQAAVDQALRIFSSGQHTILWSGGQTAQRAIADIRQDFNRMRSVPYFPLARFGKYGVQAKALRDFTWQGKPIKANSRFTVEMFDTSVEQQARLSTLAKELGNDARVSDFTQGDMKFEGIHGLPPLLADMIAKQLQLTPEQLKDLKTLQYDLAPSQSFIKHLKKRKGIEGFSSDGMRAYAAYFQRGASWLSRLHYMDLLENDVRELRASARALSAQGLYTLPRQRLADHLDAQLDRVRHPEQDLSALRAFGFLWYLGFNVKSAVMNLTQVPAMTLPYLWHRHGLVDTTGAIARAYAKVGGEGLGGLPQRIGERFGRTVGKPQFLSPEEESLIKQGVREGWLDESQASMLAGYADPPTLARMAGGERGYRTVKQIASWGGWMFQQAELVNRKVTALAAYELARKSGALHDEAVDHAHETVNTTQFEYAAWNRPEVMQGKKSALFLFSLYNQHVLHFAFGGDPAWKEFWAVQLALGGILGLPGVEDALDVVDWARGKFGEGSPAGSETELRHWANGQIGEYLHALHSNVDLLFHGLSRYSFGLAALGAPSIDFSSSISLGRIKVGPLQDPFAAPFGGSPRETDSLLERKTEDLGGPLVSMTFNIIKAILDTKTADQFKRIERALPSAMKAFGDAWKSGPKPEEGSLEEALPWWLQAAGGYTDRQGNLVYPYDFEDREQRAEHFLKYFNFTSTAVNKMWETRGEEAKVVQFYTEQKSQLLNAFAIARQANDREAISDALKDIRNYNDKLPVKEFSISAADIQGVVKRRDLRKFQQEHNLPSAKKAMPTYQRIQREAEEEQ